MKSFVHLSVQELAIACQKAMNEQCRSESTLSFELFCRAFDNHDQEAWLVIQSKYEAMVKSWIFKTASNISEFDADDLMQIAYTKFWRNLSRKESPLADDFEHLGGVLKYLNQCAVTTTIDYLRKKQRLERLDEKLLLMSKSYDPYWMIRMHEECEMTMMIRKWIETNISDPVEHLLLKLMFEYDLKPAEIVDEYPQEFPDTHQVRRVRERVMKRAKRALVPA